MGIGPGDEVICPSFTFYATAEAIARRGATPVFADIDPATLNLDPEDVAARITPRTKAIMPVHLFGRPAPLDALAALGVPIVEDAAQAFGAPGDRDAPASPRPSASSRRRTCSRSATAASSPSPTTELGDRVRMLRFHGSRDKKDFDLVGYNSRLDEIQAAALRLFLPSSTAGTARAARPPRATPSSGLGELCELPADEAGHVYHMYVVRSPERDRIARR